MYDETGQHKERLNATIWINLNQIKTVSNPLHLNYYCSPLTRQVEALEQIVETKHVSAPDPQITPSPTVIRHTNGAREVAKSCCPCIRQGLSKKSCNLAYNGDPSSQR